jgi:hypothetical protein
MDSHSLILRALPENIMRKRRETLRPRRSATHYPVVMCRSIKTLRDGATPASDEEIRAAALQFVRKVSGFSKPARHNEVVFNEAVDEIAGSATKLLDSLVIRGQRKAS